MSEKIGHKNYGHVSRQECENALEHIATAPLNGAVMDQLCFRSDYGKRAFPETLELTVEQGIIGERWKHSPWLKLPDGRPDPRIQVSILSQRVMDLCWCDRENTLHPGDPIVVDMNLSMENLPVGTRLSAGTAVIEVSDKFNTACVKWRDKYGEDSLRWINAPENRPLRLRGALCRIVQDGVIRAGDKLLKIL